MEADVIKPEVFLLVVMGVPAVIAGIMARNRGRNILLWGVAAALFPIFTMVIFFKAPLREVPGGFRRCGNCGEYIKWRAGSCKYCSAAQ